MTLIDRATESIASGPPASDDGPVPITDYAGAGSRLSLKQAAKLPSSRWCWMPKADGLYVRISTDSRGRIANLIQRNGEILETSECDGLVGLDVALPDSVLHGELEASTEAGYRNRIRRGWANIHLFDISRSCGRDVSGESFADRYPLLHRWQTQVELERPEVARDRRYIEDARGVSHDEAGRFAVPVPRDLTRLPILPVYRGKDGFDVAWKREVESAGMEGLVACALDAPLGKRGGKRKIKKTDAIDCLVVAVGRRAALLSWNGHRFPVSAVGWAAKLAPGMWVEVVGDGFLESRVAPRFPRIQRIRTDIG